MKVVVNMMFVVWFLASLAFAVEEPAKTEEKLLLRTALFVQNHAGEEFRDRTDLLNDLVSTRLADKGFSIIDRNIVAAKFRESRIPAVGSREAGANLEDATSGASALRIAQIIGADYLVVATIDSFGKEAKEFTGYGTTTKTEIHTLRISLKVLEGSEGGTLYGDTVTVSERFSIGENLTVETTDIVSKLLDSGARRVAENVADKVERIRNVKVKSIPTVEFSIVANVDGAVVEIDGAVLGSTPGRFNVPPGLHQLRVTKEWLTPWERTVNIFPNQELNIALELSDEGGGKFGAIEALKAELARTKQLTDMEMKEREAGIGIAKEQSEADAYSKKRTAEGEKTRREESSERLEGPPAVQPQQIEGAERNE